MHKKITLFRGSERERERERGREGERERDLTPSQPVQLYQGERENETKLVTWRKRPLCLTMETMYMRQLTRFGHVWTVGCFTPTWRSAPCRASLSRLAGGASGPSVCPTRQVTLSDSASHRTAPPSAAVGRDSVLAVLINTSAPSSVYSLMKVATFKIKIWLRSVWNKSHRCSKPRWQ